MSVKPNRPDVILGRVLDYLAKDGGVPTEAVWREASILLSELAWVGIALAHERYGQVCRMLGKDDPERGDGRDRLRGAHQVLVERLAKLGFERVDF